MDDATSALFGRGRDLAVLREYIEDAGFGGRAIGLVGDPGVGKSALQAAAVRHGRAHGLTVLSARGSEAETHLPFAALHQLLRPVLGRASALPRRQSDALLAAFGMNDAGVSDSFLTSLAVLELLADLAELAPVLVSLDDLHWMDQPSRDAMAFVARRVETERIVLLSSVRSHYLPDAEQAGWAWLAVPPLDPVASAELLDGRAAHLSVATRTRIIAEAEGNPLALIEFASAVSSGRFSVDGADGGLLPITARLERAFAGRLNELRPDAHAFVLVAAVDDGDDIEEIRAATELLTGTDVDGVTVQSVFDQGLLAADESTVRFTHPLVRSAVLRSEPLAGRQRAHAALARVLTTSADRATWHRAAAVSAPSEPIAAELERAADNARRRGAITSAVEWMERAADLSPTPQVRAARLLSAAELGFELGRATQVERIRCEVSAMTLRPQDRARLTWLEGVFQDGSAGAPEEVQRLLGLAVHALDLHDPELAVQLLMGAARRAWWSDPGLGTRMAIVSMTESVGLADSDPNRIVICATAAAHERGAYVNAQLARWPVDADGRPDMAGLLGLAAFCVGDFGRAVASLSAPVEALRSQGRLSLLTQSLALRSWSALYLGSFDVADAADEALRLAAETGQPLQAATARSALAGLDAIRGQGSSDSDILRQAERVASQTPVPASSLLAGIQLARGLDALGGNHFDRAYLHLKRIFDPADPAFSRVKQVWSTGYLAEAAARTGHEQDARRILGALRELTAHASSPMARIAFDYSAAVLAQPTEAEALFHTALNGPGGLLPWHRARIELAYGTWLRRHRRPMDSRAPLSTARQTFDALGARPWAQRADIELRATGERGWQPSTAISDMLSPQEAHIARLAAQGLSNRDIGQQLFLSHRTVGSHLYRIFPKLGVTSRAQLATILAKTDP